MRMYIKVEPQTSFTCPKGHYVMDDTRSVVMRFENGEWWVEDGKAFVICGFCPLIYERGHPKDKDYACCASYALKEVSDLKIELDISQHYNHRCNNKEFREVAHKWLIYVDTQKEKLRVEKILKDSEKVQ